MPSSGYLRSSFVVVLAPFPVALMKYPDVKGEETYGLRLQVHQGRELKMAVAWNYW